MRYICAIQSVYSLGKAMKSLKSCKKISSLTGYHLGIPIAVHLRESSSFLNWIFVYSTVQKLVDSSHESQNSTRDSILYPQKFWQYVKSWVEFYNSRVGPFKFRVQKNNELAGWQSFRKVNWISKAHLCIVKEKASHRYISSSRKG